MDDKYIGREGNDVTDAFRDYVRPLIGSPLPTIERISAPKVAKTMPPKGGNPALSAQDISDIVAHVRQLQQQQATAK